MGSGTFDAGAYRAYAATTRGKTVDEVYSGRSMHKDLNPKGVKVRESRDSVDNPESTPIIVALDVTGSMGMLADTIARQGLGVLFNEILDQKPVSNPHIMFMGVGDANCDRAPLQVSQFEADNRIVQQLTHLWIEHGGGGNNFESYNLPWYFAAAHTEHDSIVKRGKRGYLFTVGDECAPDDLTKEQIAEFIGDTLERTISSADMLSEAQRKYDVFHIVIEEGDYAKRSKDRVLETWRKMMGQHVISLPDHTKLAETIVATLQMVEGQESAKVSSRLGSVVFNAVKHLPRSRTPRLALHA